jgi:serpin B
MNTPTAHLRGTRVPLVVATALAALLALACTADTPRTPAAAGLLQSDAPRLAVEPAVLEDAGTAVEAFGLDLYRYLAAEDGNIVFSPYSAAVALAMSRAGATGETERQISDVLFADLVADLDAAVNALDQALAERPGRYPVGDQHVDLELATANQIWAQEGFDLEQAFLDRLATYYGAGVRTVDFETATEAARETINAWVAEQTRERIPDLIPDGVLNELTRLVLTNAIYLNAPWQYPFPEGATSAAPFHRLDGSTVEAQMMRTNESFRYARGGDYQAIEVPYVGGALSMVLLVPDEGAFAEFEGGLDRDRLRTILGSLTPGSVNLGLPQFEFRTQVRLRDALSALGMPVPFTDDADFTGMSREVGEDLFIQEVVHEAFISVDEEGTEAAAATAVVIGVTSAPMDPVTLTVDRPFIFLVRDMETGALLFMGRVVDPTR